MESTTPSTACYRLGPHNVFLGIFCLTLFLAIDVWSVYVAYWNVDGSFHRPRLAALIFGLFWSGWVLLALWMIVAY